jgi:hypothetical protein
VKIAGLLKDRRAFWIAVVILLGIMAAAMVRSALLECQTWDEGIHLAAGYSYLKTGQFRLNAEHPPLFKLLAALPLLLLRPDLPTQHPSWAKANVFDFAVQFMYGNTFSGGPENGPRYLVDSNIDWGQDLKNLRAYLKAIGWQQPICVCYFGNANMTYYGIPYQYLPVTREVGKRQNRVLDLRLRFEKEQDAVVS